MTTNQAGLKEFLALSSVLTDFSEFELQGTGQTELYFSTVTEIIGEQAMSELVEAYCAIQTDTQDNRDLLDRRLRVDILSDEKLGPVARNIIKLWYVGTWYQLPQAWRESFGVSDKDRDFIPSPASYVEGLLWPAIGAHPPGAKAPGYGTWSTPPRIPKS